MNSQDDSCIIYPNGVHYKTEALLTVVELPSFLSEVGKSITATERDDLIAYLAKYLAKVMKYQERVDYVSYVGSHKAKVNEVA